MPFENHFKRGIKEFRFVNCYHLMYNLASASKPCSACCPPSSVTSHSTFECFQTILKSNEESCQKFYSYCFKIYDLWPKTKV